MKGRMPLIAVGVVAVLLVVGVSGVILWKRQQAEQAQIASQVHAQLNAHLSEQFCCGLATIKELHIEGRSAVATASVVGKLVQGTITFVQDNTGAHISPNPQFDDAMHAALRNDLLVSYNGMNRDGYLKYLPKSANRDAFSQLDSEGAVQEHSPFIFGLGCEVRTCDTNTVAYTIDERTGEMIVAWVDQEKRSVKFDGLPSDKTLPAPLFWYVSKRNKDSILSNQYALSDKDPPFFGWQYTELGDNP
jgi:hypothetical protein